MEFVEKVAVLNVQKSIDAIMKKSPIIREMVEGGIVGIIGGVHNITTGDVHFFD